MFQKFRSALEESAVPLEDTPEGLDILAVVEEASKDVGKELLLFANAIGVRKFNARVFSFEQHKRNKRMQWRLCDVQPADPELLSGGADNLRALMHGSMGIADGKAVSLWVHPMPAGDMQVFMAYVLHQDGLDAAFAVHGKRWVSMGLQGGPLELTLEMMLKRGSSRQSNRWSAMISAQKEVMRDDMRDDMEAFLSSQGAKPLTDRSWEGLLSLIYERKHHLVLMQEVARSCGTPLIHESQRLLGAMVHLVDTALEGNTEKMANMEKAHGRALKRFQTDMLKFKSGRDVATNRLRVVEKELMGLKKQLAGVGSGERNTTSASSSIGTALDRFFV